MSTTGAFKMPNEKDYDMLQKAKSITAEIAQKKETYKVYVPTKKMWVHTTNIDRYNELLNQQIKK